MIFLVDVASDRGTGENLYYYYAILSDHFNLFFIYEQRTKSADRLTPDKFNVRSQLKTLLNNPIAYTSLVFVSEIDRLLVQFPGPL